jgi:hypothetical protein
MIDNLFRGSPRMFFKNISVSLKGLSHEIFGPVFWAVWIYLGLNVNRLWVLNFNDAPLILDTYLSFDAFQAKHSPRLLESRRMIGN